MGSSLAEIASFNLYDYFNFLDAMPTVEVVAFSSIE